MPRLTLREIGREWCSWPPGSIFTLDLIGHQLFTVQGGYGENFEEVPGL